MFAKRIEQKDQRHIVWQLVLPSVGVDDLDVLTLELFAGSLNVLLRDFAQCRGVFHTRDAAKGIHCSNGDNAPFSASVVQEHIVIQVGIQILKQCIEALIIRCDVICERRLKTLALGRLKRLAPDVVLLL